MRILTSLPEFLFVLASVSTGAALLAWVGTFLLQRRSAALRHFLWLLALSAPLLASLFDLVPARVALPVLPPAPQQAVPAKATFEIDSFVSDSSSIPAPSATGISPGKITLTFNLWLTGWSLGAALIVARMLWSRRHMKRLLGKDCSQPPDLLLTRLEEVKKRFGSSRRVDLLITPLTKIPFCHGIFQPVIIFPANWTEWPGERVDVCLTHELAHIHRGDLPAMLAGQFACLLCWFNPLVWLAASRLQDEAENAADDVVLAQNIPPETYAANLVAITEDYQASAFSPLIALSMARSNRLKLRIAAILDANLCRKSPGFVRLAALGLLVALALATTMSVRLTAAPSATPTSKNLDLSEIKPQDRSTIWNEAYSAIKAGNVGTIDSLLKRGLDANIDLMSNSSLLFLAVDENQVKIVKLLLDKGADVNQKTAWGDTPIKRACWRGNKVIADMLIAAGAPVDGLLYATGMGDVTALELRDKKDPITVKEAKAAIAFAVVSGRRNTFDWLWNKHKPSNDKEKDEFLGSFYETAAKCGQIDMLRHLGKLGATPEKFGARAILNAMTRNEPEVVTHLLNTEVPLNLSPLEWGSMLRTAAGEGQSEIVRLLLDRGADVNFRDDQGLTPLSWAAYMRKENICLLLLERGADGNIADNEGRNAAWHAAGGAHCPDALEAMINKGVSVKGTDKHGRSLMNAMMYFEPPRPGKIGFPGKVYSEAEMKAYDARERSTIDLLVAAGADFNGQPGTDTPLMSALQVGHYAAARALLDHGANVSIKDEQGNDAVARFFNYPGEGPLALDILERLLHLSGNPNPEIKSYSSDGRKFFPLMTEAISYAANPIFDAPSFREAIKILLANGAAFPQVESTGGQQLLQAAARGDLPAIQQAIQKGASINSADSNGWVALAITVALGYDDCTAWLIQNGAAVDQPARYRPLFLAIQSGQTDLVEQLIAKGAKMDAGGYGLSKAAYHNNQRLFDTLIRVGADARTGGASKMSHDGGKTWNFSPESFPLYSCIKNGNAQMAKTLLEKGADPDPTNLAYSRSLLFWAVEGDQSEIVRALIEYGADPFAKDSTGVTPLALAQKEQKHLVVIIEEAMKRTKAKSEN